MIRRRAAIGALALAVALLGAGPGRGVRASGTIVLQATVSGTPLTLGGDVAVYHKGSLYRLDLRDVRFPGADANTSALAAALLPANGASVVYDSATGAATAWSNASHTYYVVAAAHVPADAPARPTTAQPHDILTTLASLASAFRGVQSATMEMTGHTVVNGHPTTDFDLQVKRQLPERAAEDYHVQAALADDVGDFPVQLTVQSTAAARDGFTGRARIDLTTVQPDAPDDAVFALPAGYTRVGSLSGLLGRSP